jgi:hypothetical protein
MGSGKCGWVMAKGKETKGMGRWAAGSAAKFWDGGVDVQIIWKTSRLSPDSSRSTQSHYSMICKSGIMRQFAASQDRKRRIKD